MLCVLAAVIASPVPSPPQPAAAQSVLPPPCAEIVFDSGIACSSPPLVDESTLQLSGQPATSPRVTGLTGLSTEWLYLGPRRADHRGHQRPDLLPRRHRAGLPLRFAPVGHPGTVQPGVVYDSPVERLHLLLPAGPLPWGPGRQLQRLAVSGRPGDRLRLARRSRRDRPGDRLVASGHLPHLRGEGCPHDRAPRLLAPGCRRMQAVGTRPLLRPRHPHVRLLLRELGSISSPSAATRSPSSPRARASTRSTNPGARSSSDPARRSAPGRFDPLRAVGGHAVDIGT